MKQTTEVEDGVRVTYRHYTPQEFSRLFIGCIVKGGSNEDYKVQVQGPIEDFRNIVMGKPSSEDVAIADAIKLSEVYDE